MTYEETIDDLYGQIVKGATDGILFGVPVDINNMKVLVVASFFMGKKTNEPKQVVVVDGVFNEEA